MKLYRAGPHTVFDLKYHLVWTTKYRKPVLTGRIGHRLRDLVREVCATTSGAITDEMIVDYIKNQDDDLGKRGDEFTILNLD